MIERIVREGQFFLPVFETFPVGVAFVDGEGRAVYANPAWMDLMGNPPIPETPDIRERLDELVAGRPVDFLWSEPGDEIEGPERTFRFRGRPIGDRGGRDLYATLVLEEVSDLGRFNRQMEQAQRMESVGSLASGVAHDFNNILTAILGSVEIIKKEVPEIGTARDGLETIERTALSAGELAERLLTLARRRSGESHVLCLNRAVEDAFALLRRVVSEDVSLRLELDPQAWSVRADPAQLLHILVNLCINAQEAMEGSGSIRIATRNVDLHATGRAPGGLPPGRYAILSVEDDGPGIPPEIADRVFDPFFTTKSGGTGLGLSTVYSLAREQGGRATLYSEPGKGTILNVYLAAVPEEQESPSSVVEEFDSTGGSERILIVDDEPLLLDVGREILSLKGYQVLTASSGAEALQVHETSPERIPLVIMDMAMPGMSGLECLRRLKERDPRIRAIISSGFRPNAEMQRDLGSQVDAFVNKPYEIARLTSTVRSLLDQD